MLPDGGARPLRREVAEAPGRGALIVVVGPSGAGKDSLIDYARQHFAADASILFVRRVVTRAADAQAEDHDALTPQDFADAEAAGRFAVTWEAHGLRYGLPRSACGHVERGGVAIANGSRAALPAIRDSFGRVVVVHVTARPDVLAARLAGRGRETREEIERRLLRVALPLADCGETVDIDNSGDLTDAGRALVSAIQGLKLG